MNYLYYICAMQITKEQKEHLVRFMQHEFKLNLNESYEEFSSKLTYFMMGAKLLQSFHLNTPNAYGVEKQNETIDINSEPIEVAYEDVNETILFNFVAHCYGHNESKIKESIEMFLENEPEIWV